VTEMGNDNAAVRDRRRAREVVQVMELLLPATDGIFAFLYLPPRCAGAGLPGPDDRSGLGVEAVEQQLVAVLAGYKDRVIPDRWCAGAVGQRACPGDVGLR